MIRTKTGLHQVVEEAIDMEWARKNPDPVDWLGMETCLRAVLEPGNLGEYVDVVKIQLCKEILRAFTRR